MKYRQQHVMTLPWSYLGLSGSILSHQALSSALAHCEEAAAQVTARESEEVLHLRHQLQLRDQQAAPPHLTPPHPTPPQCRPPAS